MYMDCYYKIAQWHAEGRTKFDWRVVAIPPCLLYLQQAMSFSLRLSQIRSQNWEKQLLASSCLSTWHSFCLSVRLNGTTVLSLEGYLSVFGESVEKMQVLFEYDKNNGDFTIKPMYIYDNISLISSSNEKYSRQVVEEDKTHFFIFNIFFPSKILPFMR